MTREDILKNPGYWTTQIQTALYNCAENFMSDNHINRTQLAEKLGVSKGYVSQLLNGDFDHKLSKLVELSLAFGVVPIIDFKPIADVVSEDSFAYSTSNWKPVVYNKQMSLNTIQFNDSNSYETYSFHPNPKAA